MSNGYVRQSSAQIVTGLTANASDFNNEFNALQTTFDSSTGHNHDGTTGGGAPITLGGLATLAGLSVIGNAGSASATPQALPGAAGQVLAVVGTALGFVSTIPGLTFSSAVTISSGGLGITAGGLVVKAGGITTGLTGTATGAINLVGATSGTITLQPQAAAGTYNWNYPTTAGTSGQVLASAGGIAAPMTWTTLAASATTDTTNAANISSGTLPAGRLPALTGDVTTVAGTAATTVAAINGVSLGSTVATAGNILLGSGTQWVARAISGDATISSTGVITVGKINGVTLGATTATSGNILVANGSQWGSVGVSGDATISSAGALTVTKTNGTAFATVATSASAADLTTGKLPQLRLPTGSTAQVVSTIVGTVATGTTVIPGDNTIPQNTEGDQYMSLSITPKSTSSSLVISVSANVSPSSLQNIVVALFQDAGPNAIAAWLGRTDGATCISGTFEMPAGTTSATTFKVRIGTTSAATLTFNGSGGSGLLGGALSSSIVITEYLP